MEKRRSPMLGHSYIGTFTLQTERRDNQRKPRNKSLKGEKRDRCSVTEDCVGRGGTTVENTTANLNKTRAETWPRVKRNCW